MSDLARVSTLLLSIELSLEAVQLEVVSMLERRPWTLSLGIGGWIGTARTEERSRPLNGVGAVAAIAAFTGICDVGDPIPSARLEWRVGGRRR